MHHMQDFEIQYLTSTILFTLTAILRNPHCVRDQIQLYYTNPMVYQSYY